MSLSELHIRAADPTDSAPLEAIEQSVWDSLSTPCLPDQSPAFGHRLPFEDTQVAVVDGRIVGYVTVGLRSSLASNRHVGRIRALAVLPEFRRRGIGKALVQAAVAVAHSRGWEKLGLTVLESNPSAVALYHSMGFAEEARLKDEFILQDHYVDDIFMSLRLRK